MNLLFMSISFLHILVNVVKVPSIGMKPRFELSKRTLIFVLSTVKV